MSCVENEIKRQSYSSFKDRIPLFHHEKITFIWFKTLDLCMYLIKRIGFLNYGEVTR